MSRSIPSIFGVGFVLAVVLMIGSCTFDRVTPGHVGVKVSNVGSGSGVQPKALDVGWYFTPPGSTIYEYPVFTSNYTWNGDETLRFQDKTGLAVSADVSIAYRANPAKVPVLFATFRRDMDSILSTQIRNTVRDAIVRNSSNLSVEEIYGAKKAWLINKAHEDASAYLSKYGIVIEQLTWAGNINLPQAIQNQINDRVANEQQALAEQAKVATAKARSDAMVAAAQGKAEALKIEGQALKENAGVAELRAIEKWDGHLPTTMVPGSSVPFIGKAAN